MIEEKELTGIEKAAILVMNLDKESAAQVLKHMGPKQIQRLGVAMAELENVSTTQVDNVLNSFIQDSDDKTSLGIDNESYIKEMLVNALGKNKAGGVLNKILKNTNTRGLDNLKWMDPKAVFDIIKAEHPQIQSILLSYLEPEQAANVIRFFDEKHITDLMIRIAELESIMPDALEELNEIMESKFAGSSSASMNSVGGIKTAAGILNYLTPVYEGNIIEEIKNKNETLASNLEDNMFVFSNLLAVDDRGIQTLLREISTDLLIIALKGCEPLLREKIFKNMSKRAADLLKDDMEAKGPVKLAEVEAAQKEILIVARRLSEEGTISLGASGEEMVG